MPNPTPIVNPSGGGIEILLHYARKLGTEKIRRNVFRVVYGRGQKPKSKPQIMEAAGIPSSKRQQVQNALNHLSTHHLISRVKNEGEVKDGSRNLYGKLETIRAHRSEIERYADDPKAAAKAASKARGAVPVVTVSKTVSRGELKKHKKLVVLYMLANPDPGPDTSKHIRPEAEARLVQEAVRASKFRDSVDIQIRVAADLSTMLDGINDHSPQIVHFSGHSGTKSLVVDSGSVAAPSKQMLSYDLFAKALDATDNKPSIVVLNSCLSAAARKEVLKSAKALIGMVDTISDIAAAAFAQQFYAALASGQSLESSFKQGLIAVEAVSLLEKATPQLFTRDGVDPSKVILT